MRPGDESGGGVKPVERGARAVLFDLDGTLIDSLDDLADSMNTVLERLGFLPHPVPAYRRFVGDGMEMLVRRTLPEGSGEGAVQRAFAAVRDEYERRHADKTRPYAGVPELLDALELRSVPVAILSNKPDDATKLVVGELLGAWRFAAVLGARPGRAKKPDPGSALEIADALDVPPSRWLYVGDTDTDMCTARAAGMRALGALWGFRDADELLAAGAEALLRAPLDLLSYLDS